MTHLARLHESIARVCPLIGVSAVENSASAVVLVYDDPTTTSQRLAAQSLVDAFDWSDAAQVAWERDQARAAAKDRLTETTNDAEIKLLKAILGLLVDELNTLRGLHGLPARTMAQVRAAIAAKLDSGAAD